MKPRFSLLILPALLLSESASAKIFPCAGLTFEIKEESFLEMIQARLLQAQKEGRWQEIEEEIKKRVTERVVRPIPVPGIQTTKTERRVIYDPTFILDHNILDHSGQLIYPKGTTINPLDVLNWGEAIYFINGDDPHQVVWSLAHPGKIILINGSPIQLMKIHKRQFYFDQGGSIIRKFKIKQVPARVSQKGRVLLIEEITLNPENKE